MTWPQQYQTIADIFRPDVSVLTVGRWGPSPASSKGHWVKPGDPAYDAYLKREFDLPSAAGPHQPRRTGHDHDLPLVST